MGIGAVRQSNVLDTKSEEKRGALVDDTLDVDSPSHFIHDFLRGGQPDPRSPVALARYEGVKNSLERIRLNALAVVFWWIAFGEEWGSYYTLWRSSFSWTLVLILPGIAWYLWLGWTKPKEDASSDAE